MTRAPLTPLQLATRRTRIASYFERKRAEEVAQRHGEDISPPAPDELTGALAWRPETDEDDEAAKAAREVTG